MKNPFFADIRRIIDAAPDKIVDISHIDSIKKFGYEYRRMTPDGVYIYNESEDKENYVMWFNISNDLVMKLFQHYIVEGKK